MKIRRLVIAIIAVVAVISMAAVVLADLTPGTKAPSFTLPTLNGRSFSLADSTRKGSVVVLDIWATWCPPCRAEVPVLVDLQKKYDGKSVTFVGVALDNAKNTVAAFVKDKKINYTVALDPSASKLSGPYKVRGIPATYLIDRKGVIRYAHVGFNAKSEGAELDKEIATLLAEK